MIQGCNSLSYFTVKAENRLFGEAVDFINEAVRLHCEKTGANNYPLKKIQVAGTNGKGSTCAMLASVLTHAGYKTGLYTSPSLIRVNERVRIDGVMISDDDLASYIPTVKQAQENIGRQFGGFERITAAAVLYFMDNNVDIAVMETGLGGRYDTVSAVDKLILSSITSIGIDHIKMLGNTLESVANEKAGIMRLNVPTVVHNQPAEAMNVINECASELNSQIIHTDECTLSVTHTDEHSQDIVMQLGDDSYTVSLPLLGSFQHENAKNALLCVHELIKMGYKISHDDIEKGLSSTVWDGRLETVKVNGIDSLVTVDGAHNPHAMSNLAKTVSELTPDKKYVMLFSIMEDKDIDGVINAMKPICKSAVCVSTIARSCDAVSLADRLKAHGIDATPAESVKAGLALASKLSGGDKIYAVGSLYLVGAVLELAGR